MTFPPLLWILPWAIKCHYLLTPCSRVLLEKLTDFAANQEIPRILWNPKVHYRTHKRPPPVIWPYPEPFYSSSLPQPFISYLSSTYRLKLVSVLVGTMLPSRGYSGRSLKLTTHLHIVPKLRKSVSMTLLSLSTFMAWTGTTFSLCF